MNTHNTPTMKTPIQTKGIYHRNNNNHHNSILPANATPLTPYSFYDSQVRNSELENMSLGGETPTIITEKIDNNTQLSQLPIHKLINDNMQSFHYSPITDINNTTPIPIKKTEYKDTSTQTEPITIIEDTDLIKKSLINKLDMVLDPKRKINNFGTDISVNNNNKKLKMGKSQQLIQFLLNNRITNRTEFDMMPPEMITEYLSTPNLNNFLATGFNYVCSQLLRESFNPLVNTNEASIITEMNTEAFFPKIINYLLYYQIWSIPQMVLFGTSLIKVLNRQSNKRNTIWLWGPSNTGKTTLITSFIKAFFKESVGRVVKDEKTSFPFNNCMNKQVILWEEPNIIPKNIEDVKCLMGGSEFSVEVKYQSQVTVKKTPVLLTSNYNPETLLPDINIFKSRCFIFKLSHVIGCDDGNI